MIFLKSLSSKIYFLICAIIDDIAMIYIYNSVSKKKREIKYFMIYLISEINWKQKNKLHISYYDLEKFRRVLFINLILLQKKRSIDRKKIRFNRGGGRWWSCNGEERKGRKRGKRKGKKVLRDFNDGEKVSVE